MLLTLLGVAVAAAARPTWTADLDSPGAEVVLADAGLAVGWVPGKVVGLDLLDGTVRWERPEAEDAARDDLFQPIPYTPWVLLCTIVPGPDTFELIDARTGKTAWKAREGELVLGAWAEPGTDALVLTDQAQHPGHFGLARVALPAGTESWRVQGVLRGQPPITPARPGPGGAFSARGTQRPRFVGDGVLTAWTPQDGVVRRGSDGKVAWRVLLPGAEAVYPLYGLADLRVDGDTAYVPIARQRVAALDVANGHSRWQPARGRTRVPVCHLATGGGDVVVAGPDAVQALRATDGKTVWRARLDADVLDLVVGDAVFALEKTGEVVALDPTDGHLRWRVAPVAGDTETPLGLSLAGGSVVVRQSTGAYALDAATGAVRWQRGGEGSASLGGDPFGLAARRARRARWHDTLFREPAPPDAPRRAEHTWVVVQPVDGRSQAVLHRVDLATGTEQTLPLGSERPRWLWDPTTHTAVVIDPGGHLEGYQLAR